MDHRHFTTPPGVWTVAATDSIIERGTLDDWIQLRAAALADPQVLAKLRRLCEERTRDLYDPWVDGHRAWRAYLETAFETDVTCEVLREAYRDAGGLPPEAYTPIRQAH